MSLINDALKKAQKQRTGDIPPLSSLPGVGGESAARIAKRDKPVGFNAQLARLALGAGGVLVVVVAAGYFALRSSRRPIAETNVAPAGAKPAASPAIAPQTAGAAPGGQKPTTPPVTFTLPIAPPAAPVSSITSSAGSEALATIAAPKPDAPVEAKPAGAQTPVGPPSTTSAEAPVAKPAGSPAKLDSKSINFIESLRIAGIRASATDSKVLMNDHVYRVGDIVEHDLGLKLTGITASSLTFEDERGARYTRSF